jgi:hypothetical protein
LLSLGAGTMLFVVLVVAAVVLGLFWLVSHRGGSQQVRRSVARQRNARQESRLSALEMKRQEAKREEDEERQREARSANKSAERSRRQQVELQVEMVVGLEEETRPSTPLVLARPGWEVSLSRSARMRARRQQLAISRRTALAATCEASWRSAHVSRASQLLAFCSVRHVRLGRLLLPRCCRRTSSS